jgi:predicted enzyme related to lactoylglutathione lyase
MSQAEQDRRIDYLEFPATDIEATKAFYSAVFGWKFTDYGPHYTSFHDGRMGGGFDQGARVVGGGVLIVIYARELDAVKSRIAEHGGRIIRDTYEFPGGRRFHFADPNGNELAVWSEP